MSTVLVKIIAVSGKQVGTSLLIDKVFHYFFGVNLEVHKQPASFTPWVTCVHTRSRADITKDQPECARHALTVSIMQLVIQASLLSRYCSTNGEKDNMINVDRMYCNGVMYESISKFCPLLFNQNSNTDSVVHSQLT